MRESVTISFCSGYKYQLRADALINTGIHPPADIVTELVDLRTDGWLLIRKFFSWDGCSGPAIDTSTNARAGLIHDALYFLMRMGLLDLSHRPAADALLEKIMLDDGAWPIRAKYHRLAVHAFGASSADPKNARAIIVAPNPVEAFA